MDVQDPRVQRVAAAIVAFVDALGSDATASASATHYSSNRNGPHPPGKTARWCRDNFHRLGGHKEGRDWVIPVAVFERAASVPRESTRVPQPSTSPAWSPRSALAAAGVRSSGAQETP